jgi:hypothetical protein
LQPRSFTLCIALTFLTGCNFTAGLQGGVKKAVKPGDVHAVATSPTAGSVVLGPASFLKAAGVAGHALSGSVTLDPAYVVKVHSGSLIGAANAVLAAGDTQLISSGGGNVIGHDGGSVITNDDSSLVSNDGSTVIAQGGGNVIVSGLLIGKDGVISNDGGSVISNVGGNVVASGGGNVVASGGGNVVASGGGNAVAKTGAYGLLATPGAAAGTLLPAAGMAIYVRSFRTGKAIPLGVDAHGKPAYAIYTNLKGEYKLFLPPDLTENVDVVAFVPHKSNARLQYEQIARAGNFDALSVDEDTGVMVKYIREAFSRSVLPIVQGDLAGAKARLRTSTFEAPIKTAFEGLLASFVADAKASGYDKAPFAVQQKTARVFTELLLSAAKIDEALVDESAIAKQTDLKLPGPKALAPLIDLMKSRREVVTKIFAAKGDGASQFFSTLPSVVAAGKADQTTYTIERPSDFGSFIATAVVGNSPTDEGAIESKILAFETEAGVDPLPGGLVWFSAALNSILTNVGSAMLLSPQVRDDLHQLLQTPPKT